MKQINSIHTETLLNAVIEGIVEKKGTNIVWLNFSRLPNSVCEYFVICDGNSNTHVLSIADSIEKVVFEKLNQRVWKKEGMENAFWALLDYANIVVHIFQPVYRDYYDIEGLWADAEMKKLKFNN